MTAVASSKPHEAAKVPAAIPVAATTHKERSPNYPAMTFTDALERVRKVYAQEKKHVARVEFAAKHMGWAYNGRSRMLIAAMKQYGLLISAGGTDVRVSDPAAEILIYPDTEPKRVALIRQLAMQPKTFQEVIKKFGTSLPSDASLAAHLQLAMGFTEEACPVFIGVLKHAMALAGVDAVTQSTETGGQDAQSEASMTPQAVAISIPQTPVITPLATIPLGPHEQHKWKLGDGVWAEITITGRLGAQGFKKLKKYVDLIDVSSDVGKSDDPMDSE